MGKLTEQRVTNILKTVHSWKNSGQQDDSFFENNNECGSPSSCGEMETNLYFIRYKAPTICEAQTQKYSEFKDVHMNLCTAHVIYYRASLLF